MTGLEVALLGSTFAGASAGIGTVGALGVGGAFAPLAGSIASSFGTLSGLASVASIGSSLFGMAGQNQQAGAEQSSTRYNAAIEATTAAETQQKLRREQYLRAGSQMAAGGSQGRGISGNVLDIMADTAYQSEMDILGSRVTSQMSQQLAKTNVSANKKSNRLQTGASILTGASKLVTGGTI